MPPETVRREIMLFIENYMLNLEIIPTRVGGAVAQR